MEQLNKFENMYNSGFFQRDGILYETQGKQGLLYETMGAVIKIVSKKERDKLKAQGWKQVGYNKLLRK